MGMEAEHYLTIDCRKGGPSKTKQEFADEVDINKIVARFEKTGMIENLNAKQPFYGDVSNIKDYKEALEVVIEAEQLFAQMDANVRNKFDNDPSKMIAFLDNPSNKEEAIKLGIISKKEKPVEEAKPAPAAVVPNA